MKLDISSIYKRYIQIIPGVRSYISVALIVFLLGISVTGLSWYMDRQRIESQRREQVRDQVADIERDITNRLSIYEQIIRGASGLIQVSGTVNNNEWSSFIQQYDLQLRQSSKEIVYAGFDGFGYAQYVPAAEVDSFVSQKRQDNKSDFNIYPPGQREDYAPVALVEPINEASTTALGFDILSDEKRKATALKARDTGSISISEKLTLLGDKNNNQTGFSMYIANYGGKNHDTLEERKANLHGYVFAVHRANNFFSTAIDKSKLNAYSAVQVFDGNSVDRGSLMYQSTDFTDYDQSNLSQPYSIDVLDRNWTFRFAGPAQISRADLQRSNMILIGGITLSSAIAGFLFLMMLTRARAIIYSKQNETQQAKDDLLSLASHQLRTPATAVKQYLGMILEGYTGEIDKKQLPALQKAYSSNERQLDTINQILYVAKADAGRLSINRSYFDLNFLVEDIASDLTDLLEESEQTIEIERSKKNLKVYADEASLRMVIENLITNASKYSYGDAKITVKTGISNNSAYVSIIDQGVGIAPADFDKLFKKFSRIDNDLSLQVGGSGIGLYIDRVLVELHGGKIEVESKLGSGSKFTVFIPLDNANNLTDGGQSDGSI